MSDAASPSGALTWPPVIEFDRDLAEARPFWRLLPDFSNSVSGGFEVLDIDAVQGLVAVEPKLPNGRPGRQRDPVGFRRHFDLLQMGSTRADLKADGLLDDG